MYAEVAVNAPVKGTFHYSLPPDAQPQPGQLVQVAFGTALQHGIIVALAESVGVPHTKPIDAIVDARPVVTPFQIGVALWLAAAYRMPPGPCLWLFLPPGLAGQRDLLVTLRAAVPDGLDPLPTRLAHLLLRRGPLRGQQLQAALPGEDWRGAVEALAKAGVVRRESALAPPRVRQRTVRTAALAVAPEQVSSVARHLGRASKRADLLEVIAAAGEDGLPAAEALRIAEAGRGVLARLEQDGLVSAERPDEGAPLLAALAIPPEGVDEALIALRGGERLYHVLRVLARERGAVDVSWLYAQTDAKLADLKRLEDDGLVTLAEAQTWRDSLADRDFVPTIAPPLTAEQQAAWAEIEAQIRRYDWALEGGDDPAGAVFLLHGVTGSGKTEIYLRAVELTLAQGRQAIFLVPEIALTAQTVRRAAERFPGQTVIVHGSLSEGERYDTWQRARAGLVAVAVGARSALFTPFPDVGLIILDEEHDHSYKQGIGASQPYYHTRQVAEEMMRRRGGVLLLGSATPDLETMHRARQGDIRLLRLPNRIMGHRARILEQSAREGVIARYHPASAADAVTIDLPPVEVVDMRAELKAGHTSIFSRALQDALAQALGRGEQALLFLNRRGKNTYVFCRDCGYVEMCPRCDLPLAYHQHDDIMRCHMCGFRKEPPHVCPACASRRIKYFGAGTQHVEGELRRLFPQARVLRWDADTTRTPGAHEELLQGFIERRADVLVGTQMIAKGLDLPLVTLVGMVSADVGLNLPDFRAGERTFQVLTQVAGRAGRGLLGGRAILQTYEPDHYIIRAAAAHDFDGFYTREIAYRREMGYPPFRRLVRLLFQYQNEARAESEALRAASLLRGRIAHLGLNDTHIIGPAPCFFARINNVFRWHLLLRGPDPARALDGLDPARGWYVDIDPTDML